MDTSYRLPDWLGGHEVKLGNRLDANVSVYVLNPVLGLETMLTVRFADLVEVKPPSIDDPVSLPLEIQATHYSGKPAALVIEIPTDPDQAAAGLTYLGATAVGIYVDPAGQRMLARALWQRANAVEAES